MHEIDPLGILTVMRGWSTVFLCLSVAIGLCAESRASDRESIDAWLREQLDDSIHPLDVLPAGTKVVVDFVTRSILSDTQFRELEARVGNKPDHPERGVWETERKRRSPGGDASQKTVWYGGKDLWRFSGGPSDSYLDFGLAGDNLWSLSNQRFVVSSTKVPPLENHDMMMSFAMELEGIDFLVSGGLKEAKRLRQKIGMIEAVDGKWKVSLLRANGTAARRLLLSWNDIAKRAFILENVHLDQSGKDIAGWKIGNWSEMRPGLWLASSAKSIGSLGGASYEFVLRSVDPVSADEVVRMASLPKDGAPDPVRGPLTFRSYIDVRSGSIATSVRGRSDVFEKNGRAKEEQLRSLGWAIGVASIGVILFLWIRLRRPRP